MREVSAESAVADLNNVRESIARFAALSASGADSGVVYEAVTTEALRHLGGGTARLIRYEADGTATMLANRGTTGPHVRIGRAWEGYPPAGLTEVVRCTGRNARVDDYADLPGGERYLREGLHAAVGVPILVGRRLWGMLAAGSVGGPLPADSAHRMSEFANLAAVAVAGAQSKTDFNDFRAQSFAAADQLRVDIERNIHDGAQQLLVSQVLRLHATARALPPELGEIRDEVSDVAAQLAGVMDELREIAHGLHPGIIAKASLEPALRTLSRRSAIPVELHVHLNEPLPKPIEVCTFYVISEALANTVKHAQATTAEVSVRIRENHLVASCRDDGTGGAEPARGSGLIGLKNRVETLAGDFSVRSPRGAGTTIWCRIPLNSGAEISER